MSTLAIQLQPFALSGPPPAQAPLLWDWSYNGNGFAAGGTLITSGTQDSNGYYQISGVTGARNGDPIVALEPTGEAIPGNAGYPVDNLINAGGQLTASGFGYETAGGNYANPYFANFLTPPIYQEVFTQPATGGFSELPISFDASVVPGVTIATGIAARPGEQLNLVVLQPPPTGGLSLQGTSVQYLPAAQTTSALLQFRFEIRDQSGDQTPAITVIAGGNGPHAVVGLAGYTDVSLGNGNNAVGVSGGNSTVTVGNGNQIIAASGGHNTVIAGTGNSTIALAGGNNAVTLGGGADTVVAGGGDTISLTGNNSLTAFGIGEMVFIGSGNSTVTDRSIGLDLKIGPTAGQEVVLNFANDPHGVVDLVGGIGGYTSAAAVLSSLTSDGHGGTLLSFGSGMSLDFADLNASQLHAANFRID